MGEVK